MPTRHFVYEKDILKHYVRTNGWLPVCKNRLRIIRSQPFRIGHTRRLRYFTFCAVGAIDVLMLDVANVIRRSQNGKFDTVCFFDKSIESVTETEKRIPGAIGYPGNFIDVVLIEDPEEPFIVDGGTPLDAPEDQSDTTATRKRQVQLAQRQSFINQFPFDVINLDIEEFLFKPKDPLPGKVINALKKILSWQQRDLITGNRATKLDGFSLMFTTQIGPPNLKADYLLMLRNQLNKNMKADKKLEDLLVQRSGIKDIPRLQRENFNLFFKLAMPKVLAATLMDLDWHIDPEKGITIYEFDREHRDGTYKMLHLVMDVKRNNPSNDRRAPGDIPLEAKSAYADVARKIFMKKEIIVIEEDIEKELLQKSMDLIISRRRKYYPDELLQQ